MRNEKPKLRQVKQNCVCRVCNRQIERLTEKVIAFYSPVNRGQYIYICQPCIYLLASIVDSDKVYLDD